MESFVSKINYLTKKSCHGITIFTLSDYLQTFPVLLKPNNVSAFIVPGRCLQTEKM